MLLQMFEVRMAEEVPAAVVVPLNKSNCTLEKRNLKDGSSEVWKHFGYYPVSLVPLMVNLMRQWIDR